jgi:hemolysin activation/secretion protein
VLTAEGLYAFVNASYNTGLPGTDVLRLLDFKAWGSYVEGGFADPVIRTREKNLTLTGLLFAEDSLSDLAQLPFNRDHLRGLRLKADGDWADRFLGINQVNITYSQGIEGLGSSRNNTGFEIGNNINTNLLSNIAGRSDFEKIEATVSRMQPLFGAFSAFGSVHAQYAFDPLLVAEQCSYGGRFYGRAYDPSQLLGDHCVEALLEFRYDLPKFMPTMTQAQLYGFGDYGKLWVLGPPFVDPNTGGVSANAVGASAGGGVRFAFWDKLTADLQVAKAVHGIREDTRFFFVIGAKY